MNARANVQTWLIVPKEDVMAVWPKCAEGVAQALSTSQGEATVEDTLAGLVAGRTQLFVAFCPERGAIGVVFMLLAFPQFKIARILLAFGKNLAAVRESIEAGKVWAKANGCRYLECWVATESRARLFKRFGFDKRPYMILRSDL